jgi:hypothetical protein
MTIRIKKRHAALRHAGYSATSILPGESAVEFENLHQALVLEWTPNGALEDEIVATLAHALWRRKNLATFRTAERARQLATQIRAAMVPIDDGVPKSDMPDDFDKTFTEKWRAAESQAREQLGEHYGLVEMGEEATVDCLLKDLAVQERLDAMIDKCMKRLLLVRGLKSMSLGPTSAPPERLLGSPCTAS